MDYVKPLHRLVIALRKIGLAAVLTFVLLWPPVHMMISRPLGFSPWKLAGWGMYSTPHPNVRNVTVLLCEQRCQGLPQLDGGPFGLFIQTWTPEGPRELNWELVEAPDKKAAWKLKNNFVIFMTEANLRQLQSQAQVLAERLTSRRFTDTIIVVQEFRVDLASHTGYRSIETFRVGQSGELSHMGCTTLVTPGDLDALARSI
jgi:hypothetical protein